MKYALARETRRGARPMNEGRIGCWSTVSCLLMTVAGGLGGHMHGELAAELAVAFLGEARERRLLESPRTVIVACVVQDDLACWTHVGDCRLQEPRPAAPASVRLDGGDGVLLCSDGLWAAFAEAELAQSFLHADLQAAMNPLVAPAERRAGSRCDNVSALAMRWQEAEVAA